MQERLQKVLAHYGVASRRASETLISAGRVMVNGSVVTAMGLKVDAEKDEISVDGTVINHRAHEYLYLMLNKPTDVLSTARDDRGRRTVIDLLDITERVYPVGRLDKMSEGLIFLTNDGPLAEQITHPRYHIEKEYEVLVRGKPTTPTLKRWQRGEVDLEDGGPPLARAVVERMSIEGDNFWLKVILTEGRKRLIREVANKLGHPVLRLKRVRVGPLQLGRLKTGHWRNLNPQELDLLKRSVRSSAKQGRR